VGAVAKKKNAQCNTTKLVFNLPLRAAELKKSSPELTQSAVSCFPAVCVLRWGGWWPWANAEHDREAE